MKSINKQIILEIEQKAETSGITKMEAAKELLKQFEGDILIVSAQHVQSYINQQT